MKLIVDISEHNKNVIDRFVRGEGFEEIPSRLIEDLISKVYLATPIPDNATNGDVLDKIFAELVHGTNGEYHHVWSKDGKCTMNIHMDWWNAPYKKGGTE